MANLGSEWSELVNKYQKLSTDVSEIQKELCDKERHQSIVRDDILLWLRKNLKDKIVREEFLKVYKEKILKQSRVESSSYDPFVDDFCTMEDSTHNDDDGIPMIGLHFLENLFGDYTENGLINYPSATQAIDITTMNLEHMMFPHFIKDPLERMDFLRRISVGVEGALLMNAYIHECLNDIRSDTSINQLYAEWGLDVDDDEMFTQFPSEFIKDTASCFLNNFEVDEVVNSNHAKELELLISDMNLEVKQSVPNKHTKKRQYTESICDKPSKKTEL
eukprot:TRINITY_DN15261_c0_g1_i1.p1 TRINITY_DN15261_c0_g1~~TRINITY_DN15261_c0_g1_i1.p1  ORF type:complete len:276 (+),score=52.33 TRINITY_DN15261_c0_g1_i1:42-869(+)